VYIEATGELLPGWQIAASYTRDKTKRVGSSFQSREGKPFITIQPKHLYKLWTSYDFRAAGHSGLLSGLTLSAGFNGQSSAFYSGSVCVNLTGSPDPVTGAQDCASFAPPDYIDFDFKVPAYTVVSSRVDYRFDEKWSLALNFNNIFDKSYYQTVGTSPHNGNWYGTPRSFMATLRATW
jgi:outer membrane receptor for ferric coprogen and ferric-rhodotorulic acid